MSVQMKAAIFAILFMFFASSVYATTYGFNYEDLSNVEITRSTRGQTAGSLISITGDNFKEAEDAGLSAILIDDHECTGFNVVSDERITCTAPRGTGECLNITLVITNDGDDYYYDFPCKYSYQEPLILRTTRICTAGGRITIFGNNFGNDASVIDVEISRSDRKNCRNIRIEEPDTVISCYLGDIGYEGSGIDVYVDVDGQEVKGANAFSYYPPHISGIQTRGGCVQPGARLTVLGECFGSDSDEIDIWIGENRVDKCTDASVVLDNYVVRCRVPTPTGATSGVTVTLEAADQADTSSFTFNYCTGTEPDRDILITGNPDIDNGDSDEDSDGTGDSGSDSDDDDSGSNSGNTNNNSGNTNNNGGSGNTNNNGGSGNTNNGGTGNTNDNGGATTNGNGGDTTNGNGGATTVTTNGNGGVTTNNNGGTGSNGTLPLFNCTTLNATTAIALNLTQANLTAINCTRNLTDIIATLFTTRAPTTTRAPINWTVTTTGDGDSTIDPGANAAGALFNSNVKYFTVAIALASSLLVFIVV